MAPDSSSRKDRKVVVVGGGLVGSLCSCFLAKRGFKVELYEGRKDPRTEQFVKGRSVNLALSARGINALQAVNAEGPIISNGIPMHARMIHSRSGKLNAQPYGKKGQFIRSIERRGLNEHLLTVAEESFQVKVNFEHKLKTVDLERSNLTFRGPRGESVEVDDADLIVGCDGAYSLIRREMIKKPRYDYSQTYIGHGYKELCLPASSTGEHIMETNYLHIWPRNEYMMIALPNQDGSFTCTLFLPFDLFDEIKTKDDLLKFFYENYQDFVQLMGEERLIDEYFRNPVGPMVSVKCKPYHVGSKVLILGDASHAMVPFYGQGMNCGFEDCFVFNELLDKYDNNFAKVLEEYSRTRNADVEAMCDLAMYNYIEMRALVNSPIYLLKKKLYNFLNCLMPRTFIPLYTMVTFSHIPYHKVIERSKWQDKIVKQALLSTLVLLCGVGSFLIVQRWKI